MATFTITGRMSAMTVKKSFKESSNSLSSPKILDISNIIRIFAIAFKRRKAVSKKCITIRSLLIEFRQDSSGRIEQLCLSVEVYAIGSCLCAVIMIIIKKWHLVFFFRD